MSGKSKLFGNLAEKRLKQTGEQAQERTDVKVKDRPAEQADITQADLDAITPDQTAPYTTVGCKITKEAAYHFSIRAKQTRIPVADVIRRALLETYGFPPDANKAD